MDNETHFALLAYRIERDRQWLVRNAARLQAEWWEAKRQASVR